MDIRKFFIGRAIVLTIILCIAGIIAGFYALNNYIYKEKQGDGKVSEPYRATLTGVQTCLPHKDTSGPQTLECAIGMQTDVGEYYALDFNLMSQTPPDIQNGERFTASGVITPIERLSTNQWQNYNVQGIFSVTDSIQIDGKIMTTLGQMGTTFDVSLTPKEIISDSRCPSDVQCIWAGMIEVRTVMATKVANGEQILKLGEPKTFGDFKVTLIEVAPHPRAGEKIPESSYRFTFEVKRK